jgi:enoyl-[acyl-carrier protein] reductase II
MQNRITQLFNIQYPIVQAGMVWCSGWRLASAVSNAGGLGLIGAGSMSADLLREHIQKCKAATNKPFGVNLPLLYAHIDQHIKVLLDEKVKIVFTSAGNPSTYTATLKDAGITVVHVVSSTKFALKAQQAGVDAIVAEGFEAGGHNGREETTTLCLIPAVVDAVTIPVIAAGGIGSGRAMVAAFALGAEGVQIGSAFAVSEESSAHIIFKHRVLESTEGETILTLKQLTPVRLIKNAFYEQIKNAETNCASVEDLKIIVSKGRSKKGIFEGNLTEGELEIGQVSAQLNGIKPAAVILNDIWEEFESVRKNISR